MARAKLRVTARLIEDFLFEGSEFPVEILGASFDYHNAHVIFDVGGACIPEAEEVVCEITQRHRTCRFVPAKVPSGDN